MRAARSCSVASVSSRTSATTQPVTAGLYSLNGQWIAAWHLVSAGSIVAAMPPVLMFFLMQKHFIAGLTLGAVKDFVEGFGHATEAQLAQQFVQRLAHQCISGSWPSKKKSPRTRLSTSASRRAMSNSP